MPYKDRARHLEVNRQSMRKRRLFEAAVLAGDPVAIEADRCRDQARNPMRRANARLDEIKRLPADARAPHMPDYNRLLAECQGIDRAAARARYRELRAQIMARAETAARSFSDLL